MCLWSRSRSLLLNIEIQFPLNNFSLLGPIDTKLGVWIAYIKTQLGIGTQVYVIKAYWHQTWCMQPMQPKSRHHFYLLPSFIFYSCHINTCLNRWKPGFVAFFYYFYFQFLFVEHLEDSRINIGPGGDWPIPGFISPLFMLHFVNYIFVIYYTIRLFKHVIQFFWIVFWLCALKTLQIQLLILLFYLYFMLANIFL